jgi:general secretion pathway protein G
MIRKNNAFTLVEILIVVIILGILAAIVIPQFSEASNDARLSALQNDLQTVRSQLELYKVQHLDNYPPAADGATFVTQMLSRTNSAGTIGTDPTLFPLGPYLQKFPTNGFVSDLSKATLVGVGATAVAGDASTGWYWDTNLSKFSPNDGATNNGIADSSL